MKEINEILKAYKVARAAGRKTALATVVHVEGSSYRRPGARMLVTDEGVLTGAISGGCLEGDALRKALLAIAQGKNKLVTYDTADEDDAKFGVQLGCNGIVHILFEPIDEEKPLHPVALLSELAAHRKDAVLVTLFSLTGGSQQGTCALYRDGLVHSSLPAGLEDQAFNDAASCAGRKTSFQKQYSDGETEVNAFFEFIPPPPAILIAGAGNDAQPLVQVISVLGWASTVVDGRRTHATADRFKGAGTVLVATPGQVLGATAPDEQTFCILMTHNYNYDLAVLKELLPSPCRYIGLLGPKKRSERMLAELAEGGFVPDAAQLAKIYSPVGLDLGAETAEEIAISIIGEIKAVIAGRKGTFLREKETPIHG